MKKRELVALLNLSSWCLVMVEWLFLGVRQGCLRFVIVVFPDHTHLLFFSWAGIIKMLVRQANREYYDQIDSPEKSNLGLLCLSRPFWQATIVQNFRTLI